MLRKPIFLAVFLALISFPSLPPVQAQSFSVEQQATLDSLREQLIDLLLQQIAMLQDQIADILAKQADTETAVKTVESKVDNLSQPTFGSTSVDNFDYEKTIARKTLPFSVSLGQDGYFVAKGYFEGEQIDFDITLNGVVYTNLDEHCSDFTGLSINDCITRAYIPVDSGDKVVASVTYEGQTVTRNLVKN